MCFNPASTLTAPAMPPSLDPRELDEATLAWVRGVFQQARSGDAGSLGALLAQDLPPNLRNERGDSLLMLACWERAPPRPCSHSMFDCLPWAVAFAQPNSTKEILVS